LSALAISLYLATVKSNPAVGVLKTLILDDLLIGLDMSNRLPLLKIIKTHFEADYQIIMTTYDKVWYELVKNYFDDSKWKYIDIYAKSLNNNDFEMPIIKQNTDFIKKAEYYLVEKDFKASAVYIRTAFEETIKKLCDKLELIVKYKLKANQLSSEDYWKAITTQTDIDRSIIKIIEIRRSTVMNPFSHYDLIKPSFESELKYTINAIKKLKGLEIKKNRKITIEKLQQKIFKLNKKITQREQTIKNQKIQLDK